METIPEEVAHRIMKRVAIVSMGIAKGKLLIEPSFGDDMYQKSETARLVEKTPNGDRILVELYLQPNGNVVSYSVHENLNLRNGVDKLLDRIDLDKPYLFEHV